MKKRSIKTMRRFALGTGVLFLALAVQLAAAQGAATSPYLDTNLTPEQRAAD
jgi:hypothetical protein